jgi:hypothetical protein
MSAKRPTLWQRVQAFLENRPTVVVLMLIVLVASGIKQALEIYDAGENFYERHIARSSEDSRVLSCARVGHEVSEPAVPSEATTLTFINSTKVPVRIAWIDEGGNAQAYGPPIPVGLETPQDTYRSHVWIVRTTANRCLGLVRAGASPAAVTVTAGGLDIRRTPSKTAKE